MVLGNSLKKDVKKVKKKLIKFISSITELKLKFFSFNSVMLIKWKNFKKPVDKNITNQYTVYINGIFLTRNK